MKKEGGTEVYREKERERGEIGVTSDKALYSSF